MSLPVRTSNCAKCSGHSTMQPSRRPRDKGELRCPHMSRIAKNCPSTFASMMRSRSIATTAMPPSGTSTVLATATKPSDIIPLPHCGRGWLRRQPWPGEGVRICKAPLPPIASRRALPSPAMRERGYMGHAASAASVQREAEHLGGVVRGDLAQIGFRHAGKHAPEELLGAREGCLGMRVVAAPQHVLDADAVAQLHPEIVFHELDEHVALPVIARHQPLGRFPALREDRPLHIREVHLLQPMRYPCRLVLDRADLTARKLVEIGRASC